MTSYQWPVTSKNAPDAPLETMNRELKYVTSSQ